MPESSPSVVLRFRGVRRSFGRLSVLRDVSGEVATGGLLLVTGSNGSGKSTLLKCLAGLLAPQAGEIDYSEDGAVLDLAERRRRLGYVAPDLSFYEELSVAENLLFFARFRRVGAERVHELLDRVKLPADRRAGALSSGMQQRLRLCWALLARPRLLLLDEPLQNLDDPGRQVAREMLDEHLASGAAVVANPTSLELPHVSQHLVLAG